MHSLLSIPQEEVICRICDKQVPKLDLQQHSILCAIETKCEEAVDGVNVKLFRLYQEVDDIISIYQDKLLEKTESDKEKKQHKGWKRFKSTINDLLAHGPTASILDSHIKLWTSVKEIIEETVQICYSDNNCVNKLNSLLSKLMKFREEADLIGVFKINDRTPKQKPKPSKRKKKERRGDLGLRHTISQPLDPTLSLFRSVSEAEARVTEILKEIGAQDTIPSILLSEFEEKLKRGPELTERAIPPSEIFSFIEHGLCVKIIIFKATNKAYTSYFESNALYSPILQEANPEISLRESLKDLRICTSDLTPRLTVSTPGSSGRGSPTARFQSRVSSMTLSLLRPRISILDFEIVKPIGKGGYGKVYLAKKKITKDVYAIKIIQKSETKKKNQIKRVQMEKQILSKVHNPFVVKLFYAFQSKENLYFVMEYSIGGDLASMLQDLSYLTEDYARIYIAEVVLALQYLHENGIVHRDIKPDNLLIGNDGHIKLTDFGLSADGLFRASTSSITTNDPSHIQDKLTSCVGTPQYLAPEILSGQGHNHMVDWWSVGILLFELLSGLQPFYGNDLQSTFDSVCKAEIPWQDLPEPISPEAEDLIAKLLVTDPKKRLGSNGIEEIKQHPFFDSIRWNGQLTPPFIPTPTDQTDTSYFSSSEVTSEGDTHSFLGEDTDEIEILDDQERDFPGFYVRNLTLLNEYNQRVDTSIKTTTTTTTSTTSNTSTPINNQTNVEQQQHQHQHQQQQQQQHQHNQQI